MGWLWWTCAAVFGFGTVLFIAVILMPIRRAKRKRGL